MAKAELGCHQQPAAAIARSAALALGFGATTFAGSTAKSLAAACDQFDAYDSLPGVTPPEKPVAKKTTDAVAAPATTGSRRRKKPEDPTAELLRRALILERERTVLVATVPDGRARIAVASDELGALDSRMRAFLAPFGIVKIKVYDSGMAIVYSTDAAIVGRVDASNARSFNRSFRLW